MIARFVTIVLDPHDRDQAVLDDDLGNVLLHRYVIVQLDERAGGQVGQVDLVLVAAAGNDVVLLRPDDEVAGELIFALPFGAGHVLTGPDLDAGGSQSRRRRDEQEQQRTYCQADDQQTLGHAMAGGSHVGPSSLNQ